MLKKSLREIYLTEPKINYPADNVSKKSKNICVGFNMFCMGLRSEITKFIKKITFSDV